MARDRLRLAGNEGVGIAELGPEPVRLVAHVARPTGQDCEQDDERNDQRDQCAGTAAPASAAMPAEQALVGAFKVGAVLRWRPRLRVAITNTDADDFTRNLSTVRVELRAALITDVPSAFGLVTGLTPTTP